MQIYMYLWLLLMSSEKQQRKMCLHLQAKFELGHSVLACSRLLLWSVVKVKKLVDDERDLGEKRIGREWVE